MKYLLLLILVLPVTFATAQDFTIGFESGIGTYKMGEMKYFNESVLWNVPVTTKLIDDYPPYFYYRLNSAVCWNRFEMGISWNMQSTGSRYSAKDYSGQYQYDTRVSSSGPSLQFNWCINPLKELRFFIRNDIGYFKSKLELDEFLILGEEEMFHENVLFKATDYFWEPGMKLEYPLSAFIIKLNFSYVVQFNGHGLQGSGRYEGDLTNARGEVVHAQWNGFRIGLGAAVNFNRIGPKED